MSPALLPDEGGVRSPRFPNGDRAWMPASPERSDRSQAGHREAGPTPLDDASRPPKEDER